MIRMPWNNRTAPNVMLEVTDACNVKCRACYKKRGTTFKTWDQVRCDLDTGTRLRPLHTVTLSGGEPTLHPDLCRIIRHIKQRKLHVFLLTNGAILDEGYVGKLKAAGLDSILFHVDAAQQRPDLPDNPDLAAVKKRLSELTAMAAACGLDVSISATLYDCHPDWLRDLSGFFLDSPDITFLFISKGVDPEAFMSAGFAPKVPPGLEAEDIQVFYKKEFGLDAFAYIPARASARIPWISYFIPVVYRRRQRMLFRIQSNFADLWLMKIHRLFTGRYIHKTTQMPAVTFLRVLINALTSFRLLTFARFLAALMPPFARLRHKTIVYDAGPVRLPGGIIDHCEYCPTAIVRNQVLLPCCTADYGPATEGDPR